MVFGRPPFMAAHNSDPHFTMILTGEWSKYWALFEKQVSITFELKNLLQSLLNPDPQN